MRYISDKTKKVYDSVEELKEDEKKYDAEQIKHEEKKAERARRAKEVTDSYEEVTKAKKKADDLLQKFVKDYGCFHTTITNAKAEPIKCTASDIIHSMFDFMGWF